MKISLFTPAKNLSGMKFNIFSENTSKMIKEASLSNRATKKAIKYANVIRRHSAGKENTYEQVLEFYFNKDKSIIYPMLGNSNKGFFEFGVRVKLFGRRIRKDGKAVLQIMKKLAYRDVDGVHGFDRLVKLCLGVKSKHVSVKHSKKGCDIFAPNTVREREEAIIDAMIH